MAPILNGSNRPGGRGKGRRGVALLLAIFAMVVVGTTTAAYVASRETSILVAQSAQVAADSRTLAAAGIELTKRILRNGDSSWRTNHTNGRLLSNYIMDGGTLTVDLVDIERRDAGIANPVPVASTTEVEVTVQSARDGSTWTSVAHMSIPSVVEGQYAIFANRVIGIDGTSNFIGRWPNAPMSAQNLRVNIGTNATTCLWDAVTPWQGYGVWLQGGCQFETVVDGADPYDADSMKSTWVYYPSTASGTIVQGAAASMVAAKQLNADEATQLIAAPASPTVSSPFTNYTTAQVLNGQTVTYNQAFRIKAAFLPQLFTRNWEVRNSSVVTLNAGTYEIWGSWILRDSRVIINGNVRIVVNPNLALTGLDWRNSSVELNSNATLEIYNGYSMDVRDCWVGSRYVCSSEPTPALQDGDPHRKAWMGTWAANACFSAPTASPQYIEPWRIRFYPMAQFLSSSFLWDIRDSCIVGSLYLPTNPIRFLGDSQVYGRVACNQLMVSDTASFYYDHALDEVSALTEGTAPNRGGDDMFPVRCVRFGFDAESSR